MNTSFWDSNLFQTIVLIVTIGATVGIALWQFHAYKQKELRNAVSILILQIKDIEKNIEYIFSEGLINGFIQEVPMHYSTIIVLLDIYLKKPLKRLILFLRLHNE